MDKHQRQKLAHEILEFLNEKRIRCTYGAVGRVIDVPARSVGFFLGDKRPVASWVVSSENGNPTGYTKEQMHHKFSRSSEIIASGHELKKALDEWRSSRS